MIVTAWKSSHADAVNYSLSVRRALVFMVQNFDEEITLDDIGEASMVSKFCLSRNFQSEIGTSVMRWLYRFRALVAAEYFERYPTIKVIDVAVICGFVSPAHFSRNFRKAFGMPPNDYQKRASLKNSAENLRLDSYGEGLNLVVAAKMNLGGLLSDNLD